MIITEENDDEWQGEIEEASGVFGLKLNCIEFNRNNNKFTLNCQFGSKRVIEIKKKRFPLDLFRLSEAWW